MGLHGLAQLSSHAPMPPCLHALCPTAHPPCPVPQCPSAPCSRPQARGPRPQLSGPRPQAGGPMPQAPGPRLQGPGPRPQASGLRPQASSPMFFAPCPLPPPQAPSPRPHAQCTSPFALPRLASPHLASLRVICAEDSACRRVGSCWLPQRSLGEASLLYGRERHEEDRGTSHVAGSTQGCADNCFTASLH